MKLKCPNGHVRVLLAAEAADYLARKALNPANAPGIECGLNGCRSTGFVCSENEPLTSAGVMTPPDNGVADLW
jgi:hypothetical protein